jgi:predicted membrane protein
VGFAGGGGRGISIGGPFELDPSYRVGSGSLTLDVRGIDLSSRETRVSARVATGKIVVKVPEHEAFRVVCHVEAGTVSLFGRKHSGIKVRRSFGTPDYQSQPQLLWLDLWVGVGTVEVSR